jgi:hypothetical protein
MECCIDVVCSELLSAHLHDQNQYYVLDIIMLNGLERAKGIEPSYAAWEAAVLPLNYARELMKSIT